MCKTNVQNVNHKDESFSHSKNVEDIGDIELPETEVAKLLGEDNGLHQFVDNHGVDNGDFDHSHSGGNVDGYDADVAGDNSSDDHIIV